MKNIKSVVAEQKDPTAKDIAKAVGCALKLDFKGAVSHLRGELVVKTMDGSGNMVFGMSGGRKIEVYVNHDKEPDAPPAPQGPTQAEIDARSNAIASDATVLQDKVKVGGPLKIKRPAAL